MTDSTDPRDQREHLWSMIKDLKFAMFTTRHPNGHLHARPMTTQNKKLDEDDRLWFFMSRRGDSIMSYRSPGDATIWATSRVHGDMASDALACVSLVNIGRRARFK